MHVKSLTVAALGALAAPAFAIGLNMTDFVHVPPKGVTTTGTQTYSGQAGEFVGTIVSDAAASSLVAGTSALSTGDSFTAYCAELTQQFSFGVTYDYALFAGSAYFSAQKEADLSRLFTGAAGFVVDATTSAAMQAAIWEVIYETGSAYDLNGGVFGATPGDASDTASFAAFATINGVLGALASYSTSFTIGVLSNGTTQDFVIATIPEPGTWALLVAGLGVTGLMARRRKQGLSASA